MTVRPGGRQLEEVAADPLEPAAENLACVGGAVKIYRDVGPLPGQAPQGGAQAERRATGAGAERVSVQAGHPGHARKADQRLPGLLLQQDPAAADVPQDAGETDAGGANVQGPAQLPAQAPDQVEVGVFAAGPLRRLRFEARLPGGRQL